MGETTPIEWTSATWNPHRGCEEVSPGCANCFMFPGQRRFGRDPTVVVRASDQTFYAPLRSRRWQERAAAKRAAGLPHLVFTGSWMDLFHEDADEWRPEIWEIIRQTPQHTYQVLTKRDDRIAEHLPPDWGDGYPNVWLGVSIENRRFVYRADSLRAVPAVVRFISAEPLLGPLVADGGACPDFPCWHCRRGGLAPEELEYGCVNDGLKPWSEDDFMGPALNLEEINWVITGGESGGPERRRLVDANNHPIPEKAEWVRALLDECSERDIAFFHKQWGGPRPTSGGRDLDGRTWDGMPPHPVAAGRETP